MSTIEMFRKCSISESESTLLYSSENEKRPKYANYIRSCVRANLEGGKDGTVLRAKTDLQVDFLGTDVNHTTTFYIEHTEGDPEHPKYALKCYLGKQSYYLYAEYEKVELLETDTRNPSDKKFLFEIKKANENTKYRIIKSLDTRMYLVSDEHGNASMRKIGKPHDGESQDREAWFEFIEAEARQTPTSGSETSTSMNEHMTFTENTYEVEVIRAKV